MNYFDWEFYISKNKDLKANGIINKEQALWHYKNYGKKEGRYCNKNEINYKERSDDLITCTSKEELIKNIKYWNWKAYKNNHPDLKNLLNQELLKHLLNLGLKENREIIIDKKNPSPIDNSSLIYNSNLLLPIDFDWKQYLNLNKDLEDKNLDEIQCKLHYILYGNLEERNYKWKNNDNKVLIINVQHGLGNRLQLLSSAYIFSQLYFYKLILIWEKDDHCYCNYYDLFKNTYNLDIFNSHFEFKKKYNHLNYTCIDIMNKGNNNKFPELYSNITTNYYLISSQILLNHQQDTWTEMINYKYFGKFLNNLEIIDDIKYEILSNYVGIHIRMDRHTGKCEDKSNWTEEEHRIILEAAKKGHYLNYKERIIEFINNDKYVYICSDTNEALDYYADLFEKMNKRYLLKFDYAKGNLRGLDALKLAIRDFKTLSTCNNIITGEYSSFSLLAKCISDSRNYYNNILFKNNLPDIDTNAYKGILFEDIICYLKQNVLFVLYTYSKSKNQNYILDTCLNYDLHVVIHGKLNKNTSNSRNFEIINDIDYNYDNLEEKTLNLFECVKKYNKKYVIKVDDDVYINLINLYLFLKNNKMYFDLCGDFTAHEQPFCEKYYNFINKKFGLNEWVNGSFYIINKSVIENFTNYKNNSLIKIKNKMPNKAEDILITNILIDNKCIIKNNKYCKHIPNYLEKNVIRNYIEDLKNEIQEYKLKEEVNISKYISCHLCNESFFYHLHSIFKNYYNN